jgi:hypothetical protein
MSYIPEVLAVGSQIAQAGESQAADVERRRRYLQLLSDIQSFRRQELGQGMGLMESQTARQVSSARSAAVRRAAAMGRSGSVEQIAQPIESSVANAGAQAEQGFISGVNQQAGQASLNAAQGFADRPIPNMGISDTLLTAGQALSAHNSEEAMRKAEDDRNENYRKFLDAYTKSLGENSNSPTGSNMYAPPLPQDRSMIPSTLPDNYLMNGFKRRSLSQSGFGSGNYTSPLY